MSLRSKSKKTRAAVNRANARKSSGPKTEQGKAVSSQNSFKHGLYSKALIIPGEDPAKFEALRADLAAEHRPLGLTEEMLVDEIAQHYWRMKRFRSLDAQMYKSKGPTEAGSTAIDTGNWVQCIDLGIFTSIQRAVSTRLSIPYASSRRPVASFLHTPETPPLPPPFFRSNNAAGARKWPNCRPLPA